MKYIKELEGLRGVMALWVVAGHSLLALPGAHGRLIQSLGNIFAVDVFIILSGFVIFFMLSETRDNYIVYLIKRFFRIFPIYLLVLVISIATLAWFRDILLQAAPGESTLSRVQLIDAAAYRFPFQLLAHATLLQGVIPVHWIPFSSYTFVGQAWSVSVEWQFYLIAPLLFAWIARSESMPAKIGMVILVLAIGGWTVMTDDGFLGRHCAMFILGFLSLYFYRDLAHQLSTPTIIASGLLLTLASALIVPRYAVPIAIWCVTFASVIVHTRQPLRSNPVATLLNLKVTAFIGRISYSIYMTHMLIVMLLLKVFTHIPMPLPVRYVVFPLTVMAVTILVSTVTYNVVEMPFQKIGKKLAGHLKTRMASNPAPVSAA